MKTGSCPRCGQREYVTAIDGRRSMSSHVLPGDGPLIECGGTGVPPVIGSTEGQPNIPPADPADLEAARARLREQLDDLDAAKIQARTEALAELAESARLHRLSGETLDNDVDEARAYGASWQQIADALGITRQSAWERWANRG